MTDDWDFYQLEDKDGPSSIYVDLGAVKSAPVKTLPFLAYVRLRMKLSRPDGLSSQSEFEILASIEDSLEDHLVGNGTAYVGRVTRNSWRDFFFYVASPQNWEQRVLAAMRAFPSYEYETGTREEPDWGAYQYVLFPPEGALCSITNRRVCEALERKGDTLSARREIDHWAYFSDAKSRDAFVVGAVRLGFVSRGTSQSGLAASRYSARVCRADTPTFDAIDDIVLPLFSLAQEYGGKYDGWESPVVTSQETPPK